MKAGQVALPAVLDMTVVTEPALLKVGVFPVNVVIDGILAFVTAPNPTIVAVLVLLSKHVPFNVIAVLAVWDPADGCKVVQVGATHE